MKTESILELIQLCRDGDCSIALEAAKTGVVATVTAVRDQVTKQTFVYLDANDQGNGEKLAVAINKVQ